MRRPASKWLLTALVVAGAAKGSEDGIVVRQLVGVGTSLSDSGFGASAQLGIRISPILVGATGVIPLESTPRDADRVSGQVIGPPHVMVTVLASL
ncbi:MAG: hypothetical protein E6J88_12260 [Deltaproteobacteria bacterium]|nr:MAG: hypothetical protein E6J88_12260 [Deltaproteobacteria bacterium]